MYDPFLFRSKFSMTYFASFFLVGLLATLFLIRSSIRHGHLSDDRDLSGPQKFHGRPVPRVGGAGVIAAVAAGVVIAQVSDSPTSQPLWLLLVCSLSAFAAGITEDLTKNVSLRRRLVATAISAGLAIWLLGAVIGRTDIPGVDQLIRWVPFALLLTVFAITGVANPANIIDGFNGLASMCVLMMMLALAYVAFQVNDMFVFTAALITSGAMLRFFGWNVSNKVLCVFLSSVNFVNFRVSRKDTAPSAG